jgi:hypothetical protein
MRSSRGSVHRLASSLEREKGHRRLSSPERRPKLTGAASWFRPFNVDAGGPGSLAERLAVQARRGGWIAVCW